MNSIMTLIQQNLSILSSLVSLGVAIALFIAFRTQITYAWMNLCYGIPFIGKLARLSRDTTPGDLAGWLHSEQTLCADYAEYVRITSKEQFVQSLEYMSKAQDLGRRPLPAWMLLLLVVLLVAEGLGFAYLVSDIMASEGSANQHMLLTFAISLVLCIIMIFVTHHAGHQLYRTGLIHRCNKEWRDRGQEGAFRTAAVKLQDIQSIDDGAPAYSQTVNRVGVSGGYAMFVVAVVAIVTIGTFSTLMRIKHMNGSLLSETQVTPAANIFASDPSNAAPPDLAGPQKAADDKITAETLADEKQEALFGFGVLGVLFVITQIVGISAGMQYGFAGKESDAAYGQTLGFATYDAYLDHVEPIIRQAQSRLQNLHLKIGAGPGNVKLNLTKTFNDFLIMRQVQRASRSAAASAVVAPQPGAQAQEQATASMTLEAAVQQIAALPTADQKKTFVTALPEELRRKVVTHLKEAKAREEETKAKSLKADLDGLF